MTGGNITGCPRLRAKADPGQANPGLTCQA